MNKITPADALDALNNIDDYLRMEGDFVDNASGSIEVLLDFILQHSTPSDLQDAESIRHLKWFRTNNV